MNYALTKSNNDMTNIIIDSNLKLTGNIIDNQWYKSILKFNGKPDYLAINLLAEIVFKYRTLSKKGGSNYKNSWQTSYKYLADKFNYSTESIRKSLKNLEQLELIKRSYHTITTNNGIVCSNVLFITLNTQKLQLFNSKNLFKDNQLVTGFICDKSSQSEINISDNFNQHYYINHKQSLSSKISTVESNSQEVNDKNIINDSSQSPHKIEPQFTGEKILPIHENLDSFPTIQGDVYKEINKEYINRSIESNFKNEKKENLDKQKFFNNASWSKKPMSFLDFYPLLPKDVYSLQSSSRREFDQNAINEILKSLAKKKPNHVFYSKKGFLSYMTKALANEKRQASLVNNMYFKIRANRTDEELAKENIEKYLSQIERGINDISKEGQLKRKLSACLPSDIAYELLYNTEKVKQANETLFFVLKKKLILNDFHQKIIKEQVNYVYDNAIQHIIFDDTKSANYLEKKTVDSYENFLSNKEVKTYIDNLAIKEQGGCFVDNNFTDLWKQIRLSILKYYIDQGKQNIWYIDDRDIFANICINNIYTDISMKKTIINLKASTSFVKDSVSWRFRQDIITAIKNLLPNKYDYDLFFEKSLL